MKDNQDDNKKINELTPELMERYVNGNLTPQQQRAVELYLLDHPFEEEAIEGMNYSGNVVNELDRLNSQLNVRTNSKTKKVIPLWRQPLKIAAAIALLVVGSFVIINSFNWFEEEGDELALNEVKKEEIIDEDPVASEDSIVSVPIEESSNEIVEDDEPNEELALNEIVAETTPVPVIKDENKAKEVSEIKLGKRDVQVIDDEEQSETDIQLAQNDESLKLEEVMFEEEIIAEDIVENKSLEPTLTSSGAVSGARKSALKKSARSENQLLSSKSVKGKITSVEDGSPLPGVNVVIKGTTQGTITDIDGEYELDLPSDNNTIVISQIGYASEEIELGERTIVDLQLAADVKQLSEVVVSGYGVEKEESLPSINAKPIDGYSSFRNYLENNIHYPDEARTAEITGKVIVEFFVEIDGQLSNFEIKKGLGYGCDEEAVRLIKEGPTWEPAKNEGEPYRKKVRVKVKFDW